MNETTSSSKVGILSLIILIATTWISMSILPMFLPGFISGNINSFSFLPLLVIGLVALVVGIIIGKKTSLQRERMKLSVGVGLFTLIFAHIAIIPGNRIGLTSIVTYSLLLIAPIIIGSLIGGSIKK
jgi:hypothetical protein